MFKIIRTLNSQAVRALCIKYDLYTCGDVQEYASMLEKCPEATTDNKVIKIAQDILAHSEDDIIDLESLIYALVATCAYIQVIKEGSDEQGC